VSARSIHTVSDRQSAGDRSVIAASPSWCFTWTNARGVFALQDVDVVERFHADGGRRPRGDVPENEQTDLQLVQVAGCGEGGGV
jgi:hypothetical protein